MTGLKTVGSRFGRVRVVAALAAVALAAGCGTAPGAAVVIDGDRTAMQQIQQRVTEVLGVDNAADADTHIATARAQVTSVIRHELVRRAAVAADVDVTDGAVNDFIAQYDAYRSQTPGAPTMGAVLGLPESDLFDSVYDLLVFDELLSAIPADGADVTDVQVTVDAVPAEDWSSAVALRTDYLADPAAMDHDAAAAVAANPQLPGGPETLLTSPQHAVFGIFSAAAGEILIVPNGQAGYLVVRVTERSESPAKLTAAMVTGAYQSAGLAGEISLASLLLSQQAEAATIEVNPRYGVWDPRIVQVVAGD